MDLKNPKFLKIAIGLLLIGAVSYVYFGSSFFSFCYPVRKAKIEEMEKEYAKLSTELEKARKMVGSLPQLEAEYQRLHEQWLSAQELLPTEKEMPDLLRKITTAGNKSGVKFVLFQPQAITPSEYFTAHPTKVQIRGAYHQVGMFLSRLANLERIVNISGLTLENPKKQTKSKKGNKDTVNPNETVFAEFTLTAYTFPGGDHAIESAD
jgi:type IV pilus assembly protein PilO